VIEQTTAQRSSASQPAAQQPEWPDAETLRAVVHELKLLPPLVFAGECDVLKDRLANVARGEAFLLQGGDCAETFEGATADTIRNKIKTLLQMAVVLTYGAQVPVVKVGRVAGQFAKPRSSNTETRMASPCRRTAVMRSTAPTSPLKRVRRIHGGCCGPTTPQPRR
jgi:3-deoxy-7-phosphoheptulonate synthase